MSLTRQLAERLLASHPERAARVLESASLDDCAGLLASCSAERGAALIESLAPHHSGPLLERLDADRAGAILERIAVDAAAPLLRRVRTDVREKLLGALPPKHGRALRDLLRFPENTAGALMDPGVLALPEDLSAREALAQLRRSAADAGYNLYVVDREQRLVGVLNLRELFLARPSQKLSDLMLRGPFAIPAEQDAATLVGHPGWRRVHSLPVVDARGTYLGTIRYRTLRALEAELSAARSRDADASQALGELLAAAAGGILDAMSAGGRDRGAARGS